MGKLINTDDIPWDVEGVGFIPVIGKDEIDAMPEAVVRCKDCKYYVISQLKRDGTDDKRYTPSVCVRYEYAKPRKAEWYCADGERREDE